MMLSGLIQITVKTKKSSAVQENSGESRIDEVKVTTEGPKYDAYILEQEKHGMKQTLEINPLQDY